MSRLLQVEFAHFVFGAVLSFLFPSVLLEAYGGYNPDNVKLLHDTTNVAHTLAVDMVRVIGGFYVALAAVCFYAAASTKDLDVLFLFLPWPLVNY